MLAIVPLSELSRSYHLPVNEQKGEPRDEPTIKLEIKVSTLAALFSERQICAADFHCLNDLSKRWVREICLKNCLNKNQCQYLNIKSQ